MQRCAHEQWRIQRWPIPRENLPLVPSTARPAVVTHQPCQPTTDRSRSYGPNHEPIRPSSGHNHEPINLSHGPNHDPIRSNHEPVTSHAVCCSDVRIKMAPMKLTRDSSRGCGEDHLAGLRFAAPSCRAAAEAVRAAIASDVKHRRACSFFFFHSTRSDE